jgi:hypothetical protein
VANKVFKAVVVIGNAEQIVTETAKNIKDLKRRLEIRNYKIKEVIGEI